MTMSFPKLTHDEAVREVYRLTPQIRDIDDFLSPVNVRWLPYTMFSQPKNYRSKTVNTDELGFRFTRVGDKILKAADEYDENTPVSLVFGGSTAMGTGTTSDAHTLSSCLSQIREENWLNFGVRAYNATQELILFMLHQHRFKKIEHVVILSGMNSLVIEGLPEEFRSDHGQYYYSYEYPYYMSFYNLQQMQKEKNLLQRIVNALKFHEETILTDEGIDTEERIKRVADSTARALSQWKALLAPYGASLTFVLQPLSTWTKDSMTPEEAEVNHAIDSCPNNFWRMFGNILGKEVYPQYANALRTKCEELGVPFHDLNALIRNSDFLNEYIFVDRLHFNDFGHSEVSKIIDRLLPPTAASRKREDSPAQDFATLP
jgi:hypothetical protein